MSQKNNLISKEQVLHVAKLAKLSLSDTEVELFSEQLSHILGYANELRDLDLSNYPPTSHPIELENIFREDVVIESISNKKVIDNAPQSSNGQFLVPPILND
jgi:aspartyl-tRNA(Asn)/glutamyl-tRNA(Gln) amidotransferase subunit C